MRIICDRNMPFAREAFGTLGETVIADGRHLRPADVRDATILAVRSTTKVTPQLLEGSAVRFVGTATIGTDHMDIAYLDRHGIRWCFAPGCNANSVSEYLVSALLCLAARHGLELRGKTIGVVGVGNVGRRVVEKAEALGMTVLMNDPPRARAEDPGGRIFASLDRVARESDVLTLHVPLTREGPDRTVHMIDRDLLGLVKTGCVLVNAARGPVVDTDALLEAMAEGRVAHAVLDTWEGEPSYRQDMLRRADIGTPHIAGHSFEGKVMGTVMVYEEACRFLGKRPAWSHVPLMPPPPVPRVDCEPAASESGTLWNAVARVYDVRQDDRRLRDLAPGEIPEKHFDRLRGHYPMRREFPCTTVRLMSAAPDLARTLGGLGFQVPP